MLPKLELRPLEGEEIPGQGKVIEHGPVIQRTTGYFFGLYRLVVQKKNGPPSLDVWSNLLLNGATIKASSISADAQGLLEIYYKFEGAV